MKSICLGVLLSCAVAFSASAANQTWAGEISDSHCGAKHTAGQTPKECTQTCINGGASYVLVSGGKVYKLEDPSKLVASHAGEMVNLTGELKGETITVAKVEAGKK